MRTAASLCVARVNYPSELALHTASSGRLHGLDEIYLHLERDGETVGLGEVRENIEYLTGVPASVARAALLEVLSMIDFDQPADGLLARLPELTAGHPASVAALVDCTLHDAAARACGVPLAEQLGGVHRDAMRSNHCVFWGSDAQLERRAHALLEAGYRHIKLRVAVAGFEHDRERLKQLRRIVGPDVSLAVDANGRWTFDQACARIAELADVGVDCVEQPLSADAWDDIAVLAERVEVPIMLDESASSLADVDRIIALGGHVQAHLKLVKIGGVSNMMEATRRLAAAGVHYMIGQMNEGSAATAAAAHCAMATGAAYGELYGGDGLLDDPVLGVRYADGCVRVPYGPGLGVDLDRSAVDVIWRAGG